MEAVAVPINTRKSNGKEHSPRDSNLIKDNDIVKYAGNYWASLLGHNIMFIGEPFFSPPVLMYFGLLSTGIVLVRLFADFRPFPTNS